MTSGCIACNSQKPHCLLAHMACTPSQRHRSDNDTLANLRVSEHCVCFCPWCRGTIPPRHGPASTQQSQHRTPHSPLHQQLDGLQPPYSALLQQEAALGVRSLTAAAQQQGGGSQLRLVGFGAGQWVVPPVQGG